MRKIGSWIAAGIFVALVGIITVYHQDTSNPSSRLGHNGTRWNSDAFPLIVEIDTQTFSQAEREMISMVCDYWNRVVHHEIFIAQEIELENYMNSGAVARPGYGRVFMFETELGMSREGGQALGLTNLFHGNDIWTINQNHGAIVRIDGNSLSFGNLFLVVSHELGHVLGLRHDNDINSIMWPYVVESTGTVLEEDIRFIQSQVNPTSLRTFDLMN